MMRTKHLFTFVLLVFATAIVFTACPRDPNGRPFTMALDGKFSTLDPIGSITVDANSERLRTLMYNSLVKKDDKFEYVGDLASEFTPSEDGLSYTFKLRDGVKFQNGNDLSSADVKYTFDKLFESEGGKASAFFERVDEKNVPIITSIETPDPKTVVIKISRPELKNQLIPNMVPIAIIPKGAAVGEGSDAATNPPPGTGPYKFTSYDTAQNIVELDAFEGYWEGPANIKKLRVKILADSAALQAELLAGQVDMAPAATNLAPDTLRSLDESPRLKVLKFPGSNIQYLWFNTQAKPVDNKTVRQAIAYAVNREKIVKDVLDDQATMAYSILPAGSWAYDPGTKYDFDPKKAKELLDEAGYKDTNGDGVREMDKVIFKISSGSKATVQYATVIQSQLKEIGIPCEIESLEFQTMLEQVTRGQFVMTTGRWVGGNQDPIFLKDLFASSEIPTKDRASRNRGRYKNEEVDEVLAKALKELDREKAKTLYQEAQQKISEDLPLFPMWYAANMIVAAENIENIEINASGDWDFVRKLTRK
ncbi:MAG: ABC transporter substrate-binding protein [Pyrinomonadaceae bacterium]|nr:ABC transporter substrate-binding protein [Pyrinomonadaceae bacterium]